MREQQDMESGGQMLKKERQRFVDRRLCNHLIIVQYEQPGVLLLGKIIEQQRQDRCQRRRYKRGWRGSGERRQSIFSQGWLLALAGGDNIAPEAQYIIIASIERNPANSRKVVPDLVSSEPLGHERGLAEAGGRLDQRECMCETRFE
ncbi:hypothetical protein KTH_63480 [Thermosporothrix hazakensis]|nr:hypothetical protein KTH_63480 [Thermosporothrix hazakensis]